MRLRPVDLRRAKWIGAGWARVEYLWRVLSICGACWVSVARIEYLGRYRDL